MVTVQQAMVHKQRLVQHCNSQSSQHQEGHKVAVIFSMISVIYTINRPWISVLFLLRSQKNWDLLIAECSHTPEWELAEAALPPFQWAGTAWGNPTVTAAVLWAAAQPWCGLPACTQFPTVSVLGMWRVVAEAIHQVGPWWYCTAPFQQSQFSCCWLVQGLYHGSFISCLCCPVCHSSWCLVT